MQRLILAKQHYGKAVHFCEIALGGLVGEVSHGDGEERWGGTVASGGHVGVGRGVYRFFATSSV